MLFNSLSFLIFFPVTVFLYFLLPKKIKNLSLLAASYAFYMGWNPKYALLLLFCTTVTYSASILIEKAREGSDAMRKTKIMLTVSIVLILSLLFYYKYLNFTITLLHDALSIIGLELNLPKFDIILPDRKSVV